MNEHLLRIMRMAGARLVEPKPKEPDKNSGTEGGEIVVQRAMNRRKQRCQITHERGGQGGDPPRT